MRFLVISHTPTKYILGKTSVHRKHEIIEQSGIEKQNKNYCNAKFTNL
jgi:hypothetical protein